MRIKAVLFDIDGTLVDSNDFHVQAWQQVFSEAGHPVDAATIHDQIGKGADMLVPALLPGADAGTAERLGDRHGAIFKTSYLERVKPLPGARDLVARVHDGGIAAVLASSASAEELDHYIDLLGIRDLLAASASTDDVERTKPAPDVFGAALAKLDGVAPDEAVAVGDTPYDIQAARGAGVATVTLRSGGFTDAQLSGAIAIYDDALALLRAFERSPLASRIMA